MKIDNAIADLLAGVVAMTFIGLVCSAPFIIFYVAMHFISKFW